MDLDTEPLRQQILAVDLPSLNISMVPVMGLDFLTFLGDWKEFNYFLTLILESQKTDALCP